MLFNPSPFLSKILFRVAIALAAFAIFSCATIVPPTGGPKDVKPPVLVSSQPPILSTNFNGNKLIITFDEYIALKDMDKYLLISPPLGKLPDIKIKSKSVLVKLADTLRSNTTYSFYFGNAIVDITEGNPVPNFSFAFSTGPTIDSLSLTGVVSDAFDRQPVKEALVLLYKDFTDSIPLKQIPVYVSRTGTDGRFHMSSLAAGKYRLIALKDANADYLYNPGSESVAFESDSVSPIYIKAVPVDTTQKSIKIEPSTSAISIEIFSEPDSLQRVLKYGMNSANKFSVMFRYPTVHPEFKLVNAPDTLSWYVGEWNTTHDTLQAWLLQKPDTLSIIISDKGLKDDTVTFATKLKAAINTKKVERVRLGFSTSISNGILGFNIPLLLTFANPVKNYDFSKFRLYNTTKKDTLVPAAFFSDSLHRRVRIEHKWITGNDYKLFIPGGSVTDIYNTNCDTTWIPFKLKSREEYGEFSLVIKRNSIGFPIIIQLTTEKGVVVAQRVVTNENKIDFGLLSPGKYALKAIMDKNANGKWDTGVFLKRIQPEKVLIHPKIFDVKANWELEEEWEL